MPLLDASIAFFIWIMVLCVIVKSINTGLKNLFIARIFFSKPVVDAINQAGLGLGDILITPSSNSSKITKDNLPELFRKNPEEFLSYLEKYRLHVENESEIFSKIDQVLKMSEVSLQPLC